MKRTENYNIYAAGFVLALAVNIFSWRLPFFWDTILTSTITQHFYDHGFQHFITPAPYDAGHPPLFYVYVTMWYHLLGKHLLTAHLSMLPFTVMGIWAFIRLLQILSFESKAQWMGVLLFFAIPSVLTQYALVSYDAVLLSLYLAALVAYLENKKVVFAILLTGIVGVSLRGLFGVVALSVTIYFWEKRTITNWLKWNIWMLPALIIIAGWYGYHYQQTGWLLSTPTAGWAQQRGWVDVKGGFRNVLSVARCFFDFGVVVLSLLSIFYAAMQRRIHRLTILWLVPSVIFVLAFLPFTNPINHRYFLIVYVLMLAPVIKFLAQKKRIYTALTMAILILGHFLIYPEPISNGWDCTLVHTGYSLNRKAFLETIESSYHVDRTKAGTVFPMNTSLYQTDMTNDTLRMLNVNGANMEQLPVAVYTNVCNDFSDEQLQELKGWVPFFTYRSSLVEIIAYRNPKFHSP